jgi:hypothetical protein
MSMTGTCTGRAILAIIVIALGCGALAFTRRSPPPCHPSPRAEHHSQTFDQESLDFAARAVNAACWQALDWGRVTYNQYYLRAFSTVEGTAWDAWYATSGVRSSIAFITAQGVASDQALTLIDSSRPRAGPESRIDREDKVHAAYQFSPKGQGGVAASRS